MKKLVLTTVFTAALTGMVFAQGNISWSGPTAAAFTAQTNGATYSAFFGGGSTGSGTTAAATGTAALGYYFELVDTSVYQAAKPTSFSALATWTDTGLYATNSVSNAGRFAVFNPNVATTVSWSPGTTNSIMMVGWSANLGSTYAAAIANLQNSTYLNNLSAAAFFGVSNVGFITTLSTATSPGAAVFGTAGTAQGTPINSLNTQLYLVPVSTPEPGTMALAALGGASLLLFRRRK